MRVLGLGTAAELGGRASCEDDEAGRRRTLGRSAWRRRWLLAWAGGVGAFIVIWGFPGSRAEIFAIVGLGLIASGTTSQSESTWKRVIVDWLPFYLWLS
jgi:hypothetical protein